ncbi:efflux RND transporter periplasmic adaptor subunit [Aliidiomarina indica]|uniref:efflux RND transporter periplasmic adaptor subunit n=1 Tax=Aliidiomarina indica TaxID=2749147 RepID=UPI00188E61D8|nr:efflux RND transporter periplasmic adaptor subunit [Aliidiomarina indica]
MRLRMFLMLLVTGLVFGLIFGYKAIGNYFMNDFFDNMPESTATITATDVKQERWSQTLTSVGNFVAVDGTMLSNQVAGVITEIGFKNGEQVEQGQLLFQLDTDVEEAELERLEVALQIAQTEARRLERLQASQNVSESELDRARSEAAQAQAMLGTQRALIRQKTIRAPFAGVAGLRTVNLGQFVQPGTSLVSVTSFSPIYLNFSLAEQHLSRVAPGHPIDVTVDSQPDLTFSGEVTAIEPRVHESTRTIEVQATLDNPDGELRPGMFGRVRMTYGEPREINVIPRTAVQFNPFGNVVYLLIDDDGTLRVRQRLIRTGQTRGDLIEVTEGLEQGDRVATSGLLKLRNNSAVEVTDDEDVQPPAEQDPQPINR